MDLDTRDALLTVGTSAFLLLGVVLVLTQGATWTAVGIVMIVASTVVFIVDAKDLLVRRGRDPREG